MDAAVAPLARTARLFSPLHVLVAAVFGGPIAATATLAINYRESGDLRRARQTLLVGPLVALAMAGFGALLPPGVGTGVVLGLAFGVHQLAKKLDRPELPRQPLWLVVLIAVVGGVAMLLLTMLVKAGLRN